MNAFARKIMEQKYLWAERGETEWEHIAARVTKHVLGALGIRKGSSIYTTTYEMIRDKMFVPGGRYLYASGRPLHQVQNCVLFRAEDSREGWADHLYKNGMALMTGAGVGTVYSDIRPRGSKIRRTGGEATGPLSLMQMTNESGRGIMQGGSRRCLPGYSMVTMSDWTKKQIKEIVIGDEVQTRFGARQVTASVSQGTQDLIEIKTEHGTVRCSLDHKWLAADTARNKGWKRARNLSLSNKLYFHPSPTPGGVDLDLDYAYMIGFYLGNGCAYSSNRTHEVTFQFANPKYNHAQVEKVAAVMRKFGVNPISRKGHGECTELRCRSKQLVNRFQEWKRPNTAFLIPEEIKTSSLESRYSFLAGWFDADGYFGVDSWKLANTHPSTRQELKKFLRHLGFLTTEAGMEIRFSSYQSSLFTNTIGKYTFKKWKQRPTKQTSEIPSKILSIKTIGREETYDIQVHDVEEFIADDFISHNSALWAGLHWSHKDVMEFIHMKDWSPEVRSLKEKDYNFPATMDGTNISVILDTAFFKAYQDEKHALNSYAHNVYWTVVRQMLKTAEPGFSVDCGENEGENLRNACTELVSRDDSDICNIGSINMANITSLEQMRQAVELGTLFLLAGTVYSDVPFAKIDTVRTKNRRLGLGLMGLHEWLLKKGKRYESDEELGQYLEVYSKSTEIAHRLAEKYELSPPVKTRAVAPTGTIGIISETTTGIEPIFCAAQKRRYLKGQTVHYQYIIDPTAKRLIDAGHVDVDSIEDAYSINPERRVAFQSWVQRYVDHGISSTINLPAWGSEANNDSSVTEFGNMLMKYLPSLRGITVYPDGARGGQPLSSVSYRTAMKHIGEDFIEGEDKTVMVQGTDLCDLTKAGSCGS